MVDDSINTFRITISCNSEHRTGWEASLLGYYFLLCILLVFLAYQNSRISSHFAQEGEFATRTIFMIFIAVAPSFLIKVILLLIVNDGESISQLYWIDFAFFLLFPTTVLGGLYIPKVCNSLHSFTSIIAYPCVYKLRNTFVCLHFVNVYTELCFW